VPNNAIYHLAAGLMKISQYSFPVQFDDANRGMLKALAKIYGGQTAAAINALLADPTDAKAYAAVSADPSLNAILHTTCVATELAAGHATNALPQRATANVNCRIFPGVSTEAVRQVLVNIVDDPEITVTIPNSRGPLAKPTPLTPEIMGPIEALTAKYYPGTPVVPVLVAGATDGVFLGDVGIPTYGVAGFFYDADLGHIHGLNERIGVQSLYEGRDFLFDLVKVYANQ
jgi:acetylornithine deacetylase/succinyl-diaminopimelate desuccinylase-like protein